MTDRQTTAAPDTPVHPPFTEQVQALNLLAPEQQDAERQLILLAFQQQLASRYAARLNAGTRSNLWKEACRQSRRAGQIVPSETETHYRALAGLFDRTLDELNDCSPA